MNDADVKDNQSHDSNFNDPNPLYEWDFHVVIDLEHVPETKDQDDRGQQIVETQPWHITQVEFFPKTRCETDQDQSG